MTSKQKEVIELSQVERQLLLYELFIFNKESVTKELIKRCLPISDRMLQRDLKDLTEAGLINVKYSKTERAYIQHPEAVVFNPKEAASRRLVHLERLHRIGVSMRSLTNDDIEQDVIFNRKNQKSIKQSYEELFPEIPDRTRQRDFEVLRNMGYPIEYIRKYQYYNAWNCVEFRDDFGVFVEGGILKRRRGETDHRSQEISAESIAENDESARDLEDY